MDSLISFVQSSVKIFLLDVYLSINKCVFRSKCLNGADVVGKQGFVEVG